MQQRFNLFRVLVAIAIGAALIGLNLLMWKQAQIEAISPPGKAHIERDPEEFKRQIKEHKDGQKIPQERLHPD